MLAKLGRVRDLGSNRYLQDVQRFRDVLADALGRYEPTVQAPDAGQPLPDNAAHARQANTTDSPEFKRWFGNSAATNPDGSPLTVFHGTAGDHYAFDDERLGHNTGHMSAPLGHFFTENRANAQAYADKASDYVPADARVIDAHLSIQNPKRMTLGDLQAIDSHGEARALRNTLQAQGHDGIHLPDIKQWIAFDSRQVKSASENRGGYDAGNPDIRYSRSAMKSVDANEQRGTEAMTHVLLDRADAHRAMYRTGLGWVDFVWGDTGTRTGRAGTDMPGRRLLGGKGIAHLLDQRMLRDGMTRVEAERVAQQMVSVIARGKEVTRNEVNGSTSAVLEYGDHQAMLVRNAGSDTSLLTGWAKKNPDSSGAGYVAASDTLAQTSPTRPGEGAGAHTSIAPSGDARNGSPLCYLDQKTSPEVAARSGLQLPGDVRQLRGYSHRILPERDLRNSPQFNRRDANARGGEMATHDVAGATPTLTSPAPLPARRIAWPTR